jgi:hypothetical protein
MCGRESRARLKNKIPPIPDAREIRYGYCVQIEDIIPPYSSLGKSLTSGVCSQSHTRCHHGQMTHPTRDSRLYLKRLALPVSPSPARLSNHTTSELAGARRWPVGRGTPSTATKVWQESVFAETVTKFSAAFQSGAVGRDCAAVSKPCEHVLSRFPMCRGPCLQVSPWAFQAVQQQTRRNQHLPC